MQLLWIVLGLLLNIGGIGVAFYLPVRIKEAYVQHQNSLLDSARAHYLRGAQSFYAGDQPAANKALAGIVQLEGLWRSRNTSRSKVFLAIVAVAVTMIVVEVMRITGWRLMSMGLGKPVEPLGMSDVYVGIAYGICPLLTAIVSYRDGWTKPELLTDCAARLRAILSAQRQVAFPRWTGSLGEKLGPDGLSARDVLGVGRTFTRKELDAARRRLSTTLHPDRHHDATPAERAAQEEAMKRINAAYDLLRHHS